MTFRSSSSFCRTPHAFVLFWGFAEALLLGGLHLLAGIVLWGYKSQGILTHRAVYTITTLLNLGLGKLKICGAAAAE